MFIEFKTIMNTQTYIKLFSNSKILQTIDQGKLAYSQEITTKVEMLSLMFYTEFSIQLNLINQILMVARSAVEMRFLLAKEKTWFLRVVGQGILQALIQYRFCRLRKYYIY